MENKRLSTGIPGLDEVLCGGLLPRRTYLVRGGPGTGKTTLGLQFLSHGVAHGERSLCISLAEPEAEMRRNAESLGLSLDDVRFLDLSPTPEFFAETETYDIFSPAEVEREPTTQRIIGVVEELRPTRVFIDAMTHFRYLASDPYQYRKQVLSFLRFLTEHGATVLFTSERSPEAPDEDLQFLADGVINLTYTSQGRSLAVTKFRGSDFLPGKHSMRIGPGGVQVFPRLVPEAYRREFTREVISSGVPELDELLHGGLERGTVTIITGPSGVGKTTLGMQFMKEAAGRGERSVVYLFDEAEETLINRCEGINIPVRAMMGRGTLSLMYVEPLRFTPDEFAHRVRQEVERENTSIVMLDSLAGYRLSVREENLVAALHALSKYLANMGVTVLLINETESVVGEFRPTEAGISYLADTIIFLRYLEMRGEIHKAVGVLKKRLSNFEKTLREIEITRYGIRVGRPLTDLRGILSGVPEWKSGPLSDEPGR